MNLGVSSGWGLLLLKRFRKKVQVNAGRSKMMMFG